MGVGEGWASGCGWGRGWGRRNVVDKTMAIWQDGGMSNLTDAAEVKLQSLKAECDRLDVAFDEAVVRAGFANKYELFRLADGDAWPPELETIWQARRAAYDAFFLCRDGDKGVLGRRGL